MRSLRWTERRKSYLTIEEARNVDGLLDTYMEDSTGKVGHFSLDKFMMDEGRSWRGPYIMCEDE